MHAKVNVCVFERGHSREPVHAQKAPKSHQIFLTGSGSYCICCGNVLLLSMEQLSERIAQVRCVRLVHGWQAEETVSWKHEHPSGDHCVQSNCSELSTALLSIREIGHLVPSAAFDQSSMMIDFGLYQRLGTGIRQKCTSITYLVSCASGSW